MSQHSEIERLSRGDDRSEDMDIETETEIVSNGMAQTSSAQGIVQQADLNDPNLENGQGQATQQQPTQGPQHEKQQQAEQQEQDRVVLTPTTYHAQCIVTSSNATAVLRARLKKAAQDFYNADNASPDVRAQLQEAHRNALEAWRVHQDTEAALSTRPTQEPAEVAAVQLKQNTIVPKDLPALQFRGGPVRNPNKPVHDSVRSFMDAFEGQLRSHSLLPIDAHWERLFWVCLDNSQINWFKRNLADKQLTWSQACVEINKKHGHPFYAFYKYREHYDMRFQEGESIATYTERWVEAATEAGRTNDQNLVLEYLCSLTDEVIDKVLPVVVRREDADISDDIHQVSQLVITTLGEFIKSAPGRSHEQHRSNGKRRATHDQAPSVRRAPPTTRSRYGDCPLHPKGSHSKADCFILKKQQEIMQHLQDNARSSNNSFTQATSSSSSSIAHDNLCRFCRREQYVRGHSCPEMEAARSNKQQKRQQRPNNIYNRGIRVNTGSSSPSNTSRTPSARDEVILNEIFLPVDMAKMDITD